MKKHNILLALVILFSHSFTLKSQILDSLYKDNNINVIGLRNNSFNSINFLENFDDNEKYLGIGKKGDNFIVKYNDNMILYDSINVLPYKFKYNNKFSNISCILKRTDSDSIIVDSVYIASCDMYHNINNIKVPDTAFESGEYQVIFLKEKKYAVASTPNYYNYDYTMNVDYFRISIIDTLGNIERSKVYPQITYINFSLIEYGNKIILSKTASTESGRTYLINKQTLEIEDSIIGNYAYMKIVNDSLLVGVKGGDDMHIDIINLNTKLKNSLTYTIDTNNISYVYVDPYFINSIDYVNKDSIYLCYPVFKTAAGLGSYVEIANFSSDGKLNFRYQFDAIQQSFGKQMNGIRATKDGGVIMSIALYESIYYTSIDAWLIKFNPNGLVGLSNVESGEKASLRVYPNPAKDFVFVDIEADRFEKADIEIYDLGGRMVKKSKLSAKVGNRIDVSSLKAGVYSYRVALNGKGVSGKIVIGE